MTNKRVFVTIFIVAVIGLISSANLFYQHLKSTENNKEISINELKQKLSASEKQLRIIVGENHALRSEIVKLNSKLDNLYAKIDQNKFDDNKNNQT